MTAIKIFTTGGTIDKIYFDAASEFQIGDPQITDVLRDSGVTADYSITSLMRKDSLELTDEDRETIRAAVAAEHCQRVLVTHGTDTMVETATVLTAIADKTIVLTGAMQPARFRQTDAIFNIGFALGAACALPPGVYIAMNGEIFDPRHSRKNRDAQRFERTR